MIHPPRGTRLFPCVTCQCWDVSYATDYWFRTALREPVQCSACSQHLSWHDRWAQEATRGMTLHPWGVLMREGWAPPQTPDAGRAALLKDLVV
jgi:hypothetical protein